jgi:hypothetical protein
MSQISNTRKAVLLTVALGLSALASTTMAAAGPFSSKPSHITPADFPHPHVSTNVGKPVNLPAKLDGADKLPPYVSKTIGNQKLKVPLGNDNNPQNNNNNTPSTPQGPGSKTVFHLPHVWIAPPPYLARPEIVEGPTFVQRPVGVAQTATAPVANTAAAPAPQPCNCLTKQYLNDGSVLFQDICTRESAIATPANLKAQAPTAAQ